MNEEGQQVLSVSVVIPTYNSAQTLPACVNSILNQDYPRARIEIIVVDGGSRDETLELARKCGVDKILHNDRRTGEAGKALGASSARHEIVAFIDSDNLLPDSNWLRKMVQPFQDPDIVGAEPLYYTYRRQDALIIRYCALMGMNDVLCFFLGNYDRHNYLTGKWTELAIQVTDRGGYLTAVLDERNIPTMGANGFLIRSKMLGVSRFEHYLFDVDLVFQMVKSGHNRFAKVRTGIIHLYAYDVGTYIRKTVRRISDYLYYEQAGRRRYPWRQLTRIRVLRFMLDTILVFPMFRLSMRGYRKLPDHAWLFHPVACYLTLLVYGLAYLPNRFRRLLYKGYKTQRSKAHSVVRGCGYAEA